MNIEFVKLLRCPFKKEKLNLFNAVYYENGRIKSGILKNESQINIYYI